MHVGFTPRPVPRHAEYGRTHAEPEAANQLTGPNVPLLAAHAFASGATVVTADVSEFRRVRGRGVGNWTAQRRGGGPSARQVPPPSITPAPG